MNRPLLTITNEKETEFEFDLAIQGVSTQDAKVRFVLESSSHDMAINCARSHNKWVARIPSVHLDESINSFRLEVIAGGYYFCPTEGSIKIVSSPSVKIAEMLKSYEQKPVSVTANFSSEQKPDRKLVESLSKSEQSNFIKHCKAAGKIFARAASIMEQRIVTTQTAVEVLEAVTKASELIEKKIYK